MPIPTAREAFLKSPARAEFEKMANTIAFGTSCEYALLVFIDDHARAVVGDPNSACHAYHQIYGARKVLEILRELHIKPEIPEPYRAPQLKPPK